jgi:riboflavin kinase/FMN adenylyltransferase
MKEKAQSIGGESVVITFYPHPRRVLYADSKDLKLILTHQRKYDLLREFGIDHLLIIPFTKEFAAKSAENFIREILINTLHIHSFVIGYDHHFGKGRTAEYDMLKQYGRKAGFDVEQVKAEKVNGITVSSTKIRNALKSGEIRLANQLLGFHYSITGKVVEGDKIGRTIGFPTANLEIEDEFKLIAAGGVYACQVQWKEKQYSGMGNIGFRPTINGNNDLRTEVHIFDFDHDIYGDDLCIFFIDRIRNEKKFRSLQALKAQLKKDEITVRKIFQSGF